MAGAAATATTTAAATTATTTTTTNNNNNNNSAATPVYCVCREPYDVSRFMIECDICKDWFHGSLWKRP